ncbi:MAG: hypothetical protein LC747_04395 [Acidobacteria bacterium]|nr:hypothetical protein [Acidobacteriota bacterium]
MNEAVEGLTIHKLSLEELHRKAGATFAERDGFMLPANYGDARAEYEAVRGAGGAGIIDLSARGRIEVSGAEAVQFLNGLITNDVKMLAAGAWMHAAFPNVQGRLLAHARVMRPGDEERFTLAGDFRVKDLSAETAQFSLQGSRAGAVIESVLGSSPAELGRQSVSVVSWRENDPVTIWRATHTGEDGYDLVCAASAGVDLWEALTKAGARAVGFEAFEVLRVEAGVPRYGVDVDETNVVLEVVREDEAVSYTKGCYIGQEIIARIHWRGHVAKRLAGLVLEGDGGLDANAKVRTTDGKEIGRITSSVFSPQLSRRIALAILKYDYLKPDTGIFVVSGDEERAARVAALPFIDGSRNAANASAGDSHGETSL